jgi:hypothetical protein
VLIDGAPAGAISYGHFRADIATLFPGLNNSNSAVGVAFIDTTMLTDGLHTISWVVADTAGAAAGIGSRFFSVDNGVGFVAPPSLEALVMREIDVPVAVHTEESRHIRIREMQPFALDLAKEANSRLVVRRRSAVSTRQTANSGRFRWARR